MAIAQPTVSVVEHDPSALAAVMEELAAARGGWLNLLPEIPEDVPVPETPGVLAVFSKRGPVVPLGTWTAPAVDRKGVTQPSEIGIQHGAAARAADSLAGTPGEIPAAWTVLSDHPRRGVVVLPPPGTPLLDQARWLLDALAAICIPPRTGKFQQLRYAG